VLLTEYNEELHMKMTYEDGRRDGRREGICNLILLCKDFGTTRQETQEQLKKRYSLSDAEAENYLEQYWK
jgi:hypothetical protein